MRMTPVVIIVGSMMQPITDRFRISREKLAFIVDATSAPVAGLAVVSTWIAYEVGLLSQIRESLQESHVPFNVELVDLSQTDEAFKKRVLEEGIVWAG